MNNSFIEKIDFKVDSTLPSNLKIPNKLQIDLEIDINQLKDLSIGKLDLIANELKNNFICFIKTHITHQSIPHDVLECKNFVEATALEKHNIWKEYNYSLIWQEHPNEYKLEINRIHKDIHAYIHFKYVKINEIPIVFYEISSIDNNEIDAKDYINKFSTNKVNYYNSNNFINFLKNYKFSKKL